MTWLEAVKCGLLSYGKQKARDGRKETSEKVVVVSCGASSRDGNKVGVDIPFGNRD